MTMIVQKIMPTGSYTGVPYINQYTYTKQCSMELFPLKSSIKLKCLFFMINRMRSRAALLAENKDKVFLVGSF